MAATDRTDAIAGALASLPRMGPVRLTALVASYGFEGAWERVRRGGVDDERVLRALGSETTAVLARWRDAARTTDPAALLAAHRAAGVDIVPLGTDRYPSALAADLEPPMVLFARGDLAAVAGRRVAIVGTRRCTSGGRATAEDLGRGLSAAGVRVVSGLALGIDGAAHKGALDTDPAAPVIGVVGTGLDVVYPAGHRRLWAAVAERGVLLSECPLRTAPSPWRFPARNRIIAALAELVVVVESHATGGALHTVEEALRRDRTVLAVPGSVRSPASSGTNALLHDGIGPARDAVDVLTALGFESPSDPQVDRVDDGPTEGIDPADVELLDLLAGGPRTLDALVASTGRDLGELSLTLFRFEQNGWIARSGTWIERTGP